MSVHILDAGEPVTFDDDGDYAEPYPARETTWTPIITTDGQRLPAVRRH